MIEKVQLDNGVRVVIERIPFVRSVSVGIWVGTGSRYENPENNGISHFLEHMLFKGTTGRTAKEIAETFDRIGGQVNAFTSKEYTCYYAKVLDQHLDLAVEVLADMYFHSVLDPVEMEKEKKVVIEEIGMVEDTPDDLVHDLVAASSFGHHPLGYSILGTEEVLETLSRDHLVQYLEENYAPENTVIAIAGNVNGDIVKKIDRLFSGFQRRLRPRGINAPRFQMEKIVRTKHELEQAHLCLSFPGMPLGDPGIYSLIVLNNVLGGTMSSRLFQEVREERGLAYSVFSYHSAYQDTGHLVVYAGTAPEKLDDVAEVISRIIGEIRRNGITETELRNSKEQLKGSLMLGLESTNSRMNRLGKNELLLGRHIGLDETIEQIDRVTLDSVAQVAERLFDHKWGMALVSPLSDLPAGLKRCLGEG